ncbi:MAG TPA: Xaa-Pro peptidase family protein [Stellaceae bacterium]|jgi:Xaa-Pro aminopeptidase|nr:Xaa-Pro peptidase family protein [Stellaceae bacterium]
MDHGGRQQAAMRLMEREGVDVMLVAPNELNRVDTVFHLTGYRGVGESLAVLRRGETPLLIVTPEWEIERAQARAKDWDVRATDDLPQAIAVLFAKGLPAGRTATVNIGRLPAAISKKLGALIGPDAKPLDKPLEKALMPKTSDEIEHARRATAIAEKGFEHMLQVAKVGMAECDLAVQMKLYMEELGADDNFWLMTASPHNRAVQPSSGRKLEIGDIVLAEMTPTYRGQLAQICRTVVMGPPSNLLSEKYALVVRAMETGIRTVKPGIRMGDVAKAIDDVLSAQGYAEYCHPPHIRRRGHGLGHGSNAPGDVAPANDTILEEDMVFVVHPNQYLPETGYLLCGEPVRVTASGVEQLSKRTAWLASVPV